MPTPMPPQWVAAIIITSPRRAIILITVTVGIIGTVMTTTAAAGITIIVTKFAIGIITVGIVIGAGRRHKCLNELSVAAWGR